MPGAVALPRTAEQIQSLIRICAKHNIPFVARGSGTGLSGGALPAEGSVVISFARMSRILNIDLRNQQITLQPSVINANVTAAVSPPGLLLHARSQGNQQSVQVSLFLGTIAFSKGMSPAFDRGSRKDFKPWAFIDSAQDFVTDPTLVLPPDFGLRLDPILETLASLAGNVEERRRLLAGKGRGCPRLNRPFCHSLRDPVHRQGSRHALPAGSVQLIVPAV